MMRSRLRKWVLRPLLIVLAPIAAMIGWNLATGNFAAVIDGEFYRSAQMRSSSVARDPRIGTKIQRTPVSRTTFAWSTYFGSL